MIVDNFVPQRDLAPLWRTIAQQPGASSETAQYAQRAQQMAGV